MLRKSIPSILTSFSLISGLVGLFFVFNSDFLTATYVVCVAAFFDFIDGFSARMLHATSKFGAELDSLSDMVSFGVLPGVAGTIFTANVIGVHSLNEIFMVRTLDFVIITLPMLIVVFSALRLANFNIDDKQSDHFIGLPVPANTLFVFAFILFVQSKGALFTDNLTGLKILLSFTFLVSAAFLVLPVHLFALKFKQFGLAKNWYRYVLVLGSLPVIAFIGVKGLVYIIPSYIILSLVLNLFKVKTNS